MTLRRHLTAILFLFFSGTPLAFGATLFGVVSESTASEAAGAAHEFHKAHPEHRLILRTPDQIAGLSNEELAYLWEDADTLLFAAVYGEGVTRLAELLGQYPPKPSARIFIIYEGRGDPRLIRLTRMDGHEIFSEMDDAGLNSLSEAETQTGPAEVLARRIAEYPEFKDWFLARAYWEGHGSKNLVDLFRLLLKPFDPALKPRPPVPRAHLRYYYQGRISNKPEFALTNEKPVMVVFDHHAADRAGDRDLLDRICSELEEGGAQCVGILARWGKPSLEGLENIAGMLEPATISAVILLQDFVLGGGEGRESAVRALAALNVPVFKGIRLSDRTEAEWRLSEDGLPWDTVHFRVSMPELQGTSQPVVLAAATPPAMDALTGLKLTVTQPIPRQVEFLAGRVLKWTSLQRKPNKEKRIALIYYNHPPGRHNIGADNLDVPASLWEILGMLKDAGYETGEIPANAEALLELMQERGVNLPEDEEALKMMAPNINRLSAERYETWFQTLPKILRMELRFGPLGYLHGALYDAMENSMPQTGEKLLERNMGNIKHLLEGVEHPQRGRALDLLDQLHEIYRRNLLGENHWKKAETLVKALRNTRIEGLRGWGDPPGTVMVYRDEILIPGIQFGNVFIGPQPPRGWEVDEELLHANTSFPPTHQYLAFYHWLRHVFQADALVHLGRHSTYEFLPRRRVGLTWEDYPSLIAGDLPGIYPYIVDGVGEGLQAKRRGLAVIIDHLTPPLKTTPLYEDLLELRQLIESFESAEAHSNSPARIRAVEAIRKKIEELNLRDELETSMAEQLRVRGIQFDEVDDDLLVHELGHYLTKLQEAFMPHGLHVFARDWKKEAVDMMLESMSGEEAAPREWREALEGSPRHERQAFFQALEGRFVLPGKGNDPIRTPEVLPTGRNFHGLDGSLLPTRVAYELGRELARKARVSGKTSEAGVEAVVLWASDTVRDEGVMVAFGMDMLGIKPVWNSRGILQGLEQVSPEDGRVRRDIVFTTSGLFRDLYGNLLVWLDRAFLLALDASSETIRRDHPALRPALDAALNRLGEFSNPGNEPISQNQAASHWIQSARKALAGGLGPEEAGRAASLRIFGDAPGAYGTGINRLVERSGAWKGRKEVVDIYLRRMAHAYGADFDGVSAVGSFREILSRVENTYLGRASNLYALLDNNDAFDYLGGLSMAVETLTGKVPFNRVIHHADPKNAAMEPLETALLKEFRGKYLNPAWLLPLMQHGYAGARTMGSEFLEYLWGWQVTNPEIIRSWVWDEVKRVYLDDGLGIGLDQFLEEGQNVHVKTNMMAILLVAAHKGYWQTDEKILQALSREFAELVVKHGLPGSGHTRPDHPVFNEIMPRLDKELEVQLTRILERAKGAEKPKPAPAPAVVAEIKPVTQQAELSPDAARPAEEPGEKKVAIPAGRAWVMGMTLSLLFAGGVLTGRKGKIHVHH